MILSTHDASAEHLDRLTELCLAARTLIDEQGSPVMRRLIDLLLFEVAEHVARALATASPPSDRSPGGLLGN